jgi:protein-export membrane protein SecD/preprotein translocase SecF subunit
MATQLQARAPWTRLAVTVAATATAACLAWPLEEKITLGLDLQGGTHMVLEVDLDEAVRSMGERTAEGIRTELGAAGVTFERLAQDRPGRIVLARVDPAVQDAARGVLDAHQAQWDVTWSGGGATLDLRPAVDQDVRTSAARQVRDTIGRRINEFGVLEPTIAAQGERGERIVVQLPGLDDVDRVKRIITKASVMEFRLGRGTGGAREDALAQVQPALLGTVDAFPGAAGTREGGRWYVVDRASVVRGEDLIDARATTDEFGRPCIEFALSPEAGTRFGDLTGNNVGSMLAVVLDGQVVQYATIQSRITTRGQITGNYSIQEAQDAALTLKSGALPAKVSILFEQTVGPSLGRDSIRAGVRASLLGFGLVVLFMLLWYKGAGVNALVALVLNVVLTVGLLAAIDATLTLPGIAGLVLTMGMAVDANVIIFERIREELASGKGPLAAIDAGFDKAWSAIFDSNLTTLLACFFLYNFGTGPIRGFAVTLALGLVVSMFTAIWVSHALFHLLFWLRPGTRTLSIEWFAAKAPSFPFMRIGPLMGGISGVAIALLVAATLVIGIRRGVDFAGGSEVVVKTRDAVTAEDLRQRLRGTEFADVTIQEFGARGERQFLLRIADAASAESKATVNAPEGEGAEEAAAVRLVALLSDSRAGVLDLNTAGRRTIQETLQAGLSISQSEAEAIAEALVAARLEQGGLIASVDALASVPGVTPAALAWIRDDAQAGSLAVVSSTSVGPAVGAQLATQAQHAIAWSLLAILVYMWFRFELRFGVAAIVALAHDVVVTVGVLVLLGQEFDISVIAALLTLVGYSVNDTIVMFDRVRENLKIMKGATLAEVLDASVNQTLMRTILTAGTVFVAVLALLLLGGPVLHGFSLALTIGVITGTYSTTFVASPVVLLWDRLRQARAAREMQAA